jgi:hypothetical protein
MTKLIVAFGNLEKAPKKEVLAMNVQEQAGNKLN